MSTAIGIRFIAGRYHALPWDRHVNEADVEWPPSPLRLLRALIAVWHRKVDPKQFPEQTLHSLIETLAGESPLYRLPVARLAHTRHYMPVRSGRGETRTLIYDAFVRLDPEDELVVIWRDSVLDKETERLLAHLLERVGYLGRAESWSECRLLESWEDAFDSGPASSADRWRAPASEGMQAVELPVPLAGDEYARRRADQIARLGLENIKGRKEKQLISTLPEQLLDALRLDTGDLRAAGWSRSPATHRVTYLRPADCFRPLAGRWSATVELSIPEGNPTTVRLVLSRKSYADGRLGPPLPRLENAIKIGEVVRVAAMSMFRDDYVGVPPVLSGHEMPADQPHQHAFFLPEDSTADGRIDHVIVHAEAGFDVASLRALGELERIWLREGSEWSVLLESYGAAVDFDRHPYLRSARTWESVTPYLHPWFRKPSFKVADQIQREVTARGLPSPGVEFFRTVNVGGTDRRSAHFHRFRNRQGLLQPDTRGSFWRLSFPQAVPGPLALGFGCHFGLGMFKAIE